MNCPSYYRVSDTFSYVMLLTDIAAVNLNVPLAIFLEARDDGDAKLAVGIGT